MDSDADAICDLARSLNEQPQKRTDQWLKHSGALTKKRLCDERTGSRIQGKTDSSSHFCTLMGRTSISPEHTIDPHVNEQIEKDLPRTGQERQIDGSSEKLRHVLTCYAQHNPTIGYCQSMNFVAAELLLAHEGASPKDFDGSEECSFWIMAAVVDDLFTDYYDSHLSGLRVDIGVAEDLVRENLPRLAAHLEEHSVTLAPVLVELMMTLGILRLPREVVHTWWTCLFMWHHRQTQEGAAGVGAKGLGLGMVLALLARNEKILLQQDGLMELMHMMSNQIFGLSDGVEADVAEGYAIIKDAIRWEGKLKSQGLQERQRLQRKVLDEEDKQVALRRATDSGPTSGMLPQLQEWAAAVGSAAGAVPLWQLAAGGVAIGVPIAAVYGSQLNKATNAVLNSKGNGSVRGSGYLKIFVAAGVLAAAAAVYANGASKSESNNRKAAKGAK
jgi:hypothetical protein